jgi:hypothetical protein
MEVLVGRGMEFSIQVGPENIWSGASAGSTGADVVGI